MTVSKFKVGDRVYAPFHGYGTVTKIHEDKCVYPIIVTWDDTNVPFMEDVSSFTEDGCLLQYSDNDITVLKVVDKESTKKEKKSMAEEADTGVVDRMMDALDKKTDDAINPAHYKVKGLPEAHEIMSHLMHREQLEGFYWGNIIKYSYRYGRKGDKAETAGKIAWYAKRLEEVLKGEHNEA